MGKLCKWEIRIPNGTFLEIEPFEYTLDCLPWVEGESSYNDDRILTTGFAGGTTVVTSEQTKGRKCQGNWERTTSIQRNNGLVKSNSSTTVSLVCLCVLCS